MTGGGLKDEDDGVHAIGYWMGTSQQDSLSRTTRTQEYNLTTDDDGDAKEGDGTIMVTVTANPAHDDGSADLSVQLDAPRSIASITTPMDCHRPHA